MDVNLLFSPLDQACEICDTDQPYLYSKRTNSKHDREFPVIQRETTSLKPQPHHNHKECKDLQGAWGCGGAAMCASLIRWICTAHAGFADFMQHPHIISITLDCEPFYLKGLFSNKFRSHSQGPKAKRRPFYERGRVKYNHVTLFSCLTCSM